MSHTGSDTAAVYRAGTIKRLRATKADMAAREDFLVAYAEANGPVTVRGLYYQAEVAGLPGIDKTESGYRKVQAQVLALRRAGRMSYDAISDATRYMRKPRTFDGWEAALNETARTYRKALWTDTGLEVEIWIEKSALAGVLFPVTAEFDVPLMCTGGFSSETFAHEAVARLKGTGRTLVAYTFYDFDRAGQDAAASLAEKVSRFGAAYDVPVHVSRRALDVAQVRDLGLPTRPARQGTAADRRWSCPFAAELDAIPPRTLRAMVRDAIEQHLPREELTRLKAIEHSERDTLLSYLGGIDDGG